MRLVDSHCHLQAERFDRDVDLVLGAVSVTRSFDVEAAYLTGFVPVQESGILHYANTGPIFTGLIPAGWWTERATFSDPNGSSLVEASLAL